MTRKASTGNVSRGVEGLLARLAELRDRGEALRVEDETLRKAPAARAEAEARVEAWVAARMRGWSPHVGAFAVAEEREAPDFVLALPLRGQAPADAAECALVALHPEAVRAGLLARLDDFYATTPEGHPAAVRRARLVELGTARARCEREEEETVRSVEALGIDCERRAEADAVAVYDIVTEEEGA